MISRRTLFGKAVLEWMNSSACISNRGGGIRFNFSFKNLEVKGGGGCDSSPAFDIQVVFGIVFIIKCKDSHQNGQLYTGFCVPWCCSQPELKQLPYPYGGESTQGECSHVTL